MALLNFHYLVTAFGLTVFTHAPAVVMALIWAVQAIMFIADIAVVDLDDYVFWNFISALAGMLVGVGLLLVSRVPPFLKFEGSYVGVWGQFLIWFVLYIAAQMFYGFFPPPGQPWGIVGTMVSHTLIHVVLWWVMYYNEIVFRGYKGRKYFFFLWVIMVIVMENLFFLAYVVLERWAAYIAAGGGVAILLIAGLVFPLREPYSNATPTSLEPLVNPRFGGASSPEMSSSSSSPNQQQQGQMENYY
jgi:hypothetical protein